MTGTRASKKSRRIFFTTSLQIDRRTCLSFLNLLTFCPNHQLLLSPEANPQHIIAASHRVRLTPWIIHSALSTCLGGKKLKEKINPSCFCSFSSSSSSFLFHYKSHRFSFPSPVLGSGLMCTEMLCEANKAKAARIYPSERQPARQAPVCLSASLCVSHLIGNN